MSKNPCNIDDEYLYTCDTCEIPLYNNLFAYNGAAYCKRCYTKLFKISYKIAYRNRFKYNPPNNITALAISETPIFLPYTENHLIREVIKNLQILENKYGDGALDMGAELALQQKAKEIISYLYDEIKTRKIAQYDENIALYVIVEV